VALAAVLPENDGGTADGEVAAGCLATTLYTASLFAGSGDQRYTGPSRLDISDGVAFQEATRCGLLPAAVQSEL